MNNSNTAPNLQPDDEKLKASAGGSASGDVQMKGMAKPVNFHFCSGGRFVKDFGSTTGFFWMRSAPRQQYGLCGKQEHVAQRISKPNQAAGNGTEEISEGFEKRHDESDWKNLPTNFPMNMR
ncbi:MAG: hypothetical protein U0519_01120 [Candidatus Gracilibacteria bacterium]